MIPLIHVTAIALGPLRIQVWGLLVAIGLLSGLWLAVQEGKRRDLNSEDIVDIGFWVIVSALIGGRIFYVLTELGEFVDAPIDVFKVWEGGMSISGGFIGALFAAWFSIRKKQLPQEKTLESLIFGLPLGLAIGRLGCFLIFDHPGRATTFFLGERYLDGVVRHNHGLYLSLNGLAILLFFHFLRSQGKERAPYFYNRTILLWYGVVRFFLDFFRATDLPHSDSRFFGLTGAQYLSIVMVAAGLYLWYRFDYGTTKKKETSA